MANRVMIGGGGALFVGEDKTISVEVLDADDIPVNITGWGVALSVKSEEADAVAVLSATASITGTYNATRAVNTQRAAFTLTDTQTAAVVAGLYRYSVKRTDDGSETIVAFGPFEVELATQT